MMFWRTFKAAVMQVLARVVFTMTAAAETLPCETIAPIIVPPMEPGEPINDKGVWSLLNSGGAAGTPCGDADAGSGLVYLDGVTKATASVRIAHQTILAAVRHVAQEKMQGISAEPPAFPDPASLADLVHFQPIATTDEPILFIDIGRHGLVSEDFVRTTSPDFLEAVQDDLSVALRDNDLFVTLSEVVPAALHDGARMALRTDRRLGLDPTVQPLWRGRFDYGLNLIRGYGPVQDAARGQALFDQAAAAGLPIAQRM